MAVTSYAPEMLELFKKAAQDEVIVPLQSAKAAIHMRARLHNLRRDMRKERHPLMNLANGVQFSVTSEGDLRAYPADVKYLSALRSAVAKSTATATETGIALQESPINTNLPPANEEEVAAMQNVLSNFFEAKPPPTPTKE